MKVRIDLPKRRETPTKNPTGKKWSQHKPDLREDFNLHCGYCGSFDGFRHTWYEVDHFIPKSFIEKNNIDIGLCQYSNLVYSCKFCNNNKSSKWPSESAEIFNVNDKGFIDPCNEEFDNHLYRTNDGEIMWNTDLGKWMATQAFKFDEREKEIKLLWNFNELRKTILLLGQFLEEFEEDTDIYKETKLKAGEYSYSYFQVHNELIDYYNNL